MQFKKGHKAYKPAEGTKRKPRRSLKDAIQAKCVECVVDPDIPGLGTWLQQITECSSPTCPLYPVRPITRKEKKKND